MTETMEKTDQLILAQLIQNARIALQTISEETKLSLSTVARRIQKLEQTTIRGYRLVVNYAAFAYDEYDIYYQFTQAKEKQPLAFEKSPWVTQVAAVLGDFDLRVTIWAKSMSHLGSILEAIEQDTAQTISRREIICVTKKYKTPAHTFASMVLGNTVRSRVKTKTQPLYKQAKKTVDALDAQIITALASNPRASYQEIAHSCNRTPEAISYRVHKLEEQDIILGYKALIDGQRLGYLWASLLIASQDINAEQKQKVIAHVQNNPAVSAIVETVGAYTLSITFFAKDATKLKETERELRSTLAGYTYQSTLVVLLNNTKQPEYAAAVIEESVQGKSTR